MWDFGMTYCRTPVVIQPIIFLTPRGSEQIHRCSPGTIQVINASVACNGELFFHFYSVLKKKKWEYYSIFWYFCGSLGFKNDVTISVLCHYYSNSNHRFVLWDVQQCDSCFVLCFSLFHSLYTKVVILHVWSVKVS